MYCIVFAVYILSSLFLSIDAQTDKPSLYRLSYPSSKQYMPYGKSTSTSTEGPESAQIPGSRWFSAGSAPSPAYASSEPAPRGASR